MQQTAVLLPLTVLAMLIGPDQSCEVILLRADHSQLSLHGRMLSLQGQGGWPAAAPALPFSPEAALTPLLRILHKQRLFQMSPLLAWHWCQSRQQSLFCQRSCGSSFRAQPNRGTRACLAAWPGLPEMLWAGSASRTAALGAALQRQQPRQPAHLWSLEPGRPELHWSAAALRSPTGHSAAAPPAALTACIARQLWADQWQPWTVYYLSKPGPDFCGEVLLGHPATWSATGACISTQSGDIEWGSHMAELSCRQVPQTFVPWQQPRDQVVVAGVVRHTFQMTPFAWPAAAFPAQPPSLLDSGPQPHCCCLHSSLEGQRLLRQLLGQLPGPQEPCWPQQPLMPLPALLPGSRAGACRQQLPSSARIYYSNWPQLVPHTHDPIAFS